MKKLTTEDLQKKFSDLLETETSILCTEDGQAFYNTPQGKSHAYGHAANVKVKVIEVKAAKKAAKKKTTKKDDK